MANLFLADFGSQIETQPANLKALAERWEEIRFLASTLRGEIPSPFHIMFTGCGDSLQVAQSGVLMIQHHAKSPHVSLVLSLDAVTAFQPRFYRAPYHRGSRFLVAVSASGETTQTVKALSTMREEGWFTFALTNRPLCALTEQAHAAFSMNIDTQSLTHAVATTSTAIWAIQALTANLMEPNPQSPGYAEAYHALHQIPQSLQKILDQELLHAGVQTGAELIVSVLTSRPPCDARLTNTISVLSGGPTMPAAELLALKLGELTALHSTAYNIEEFIHSPLNTIMSSTPLVILIPDKNVHARAKPLAKLLEPYGNTIVEIAPEGYPPLTEATIPIRLPTGLLPSAYLTLPLLLTGELLVLRIASQLPDPPTGWRYGEAHAKLISQA